MNCEVNIPVPPQRIISLVPSQTELLFDLGVGDKIVGITKFCVHPIEVKSKTKIGGTKIFHFDAIDELQPDLIIGNKEENYEEGIEQLKQKYPVWMSDVFSLADAYRMMLEIGLLTNTYDKSASLVQQIKNKFAGVVKFEPLRTLYFIWKAPWMAVGKNTFIDSIMRELGLVNVVSETRYPHLTNDEIKQLDPEIIFLSSEPFPFREKHIQELQALLPQSKIVLADGEMFSWYGSRLLRAPDYFQSLRTQLV
jgi:ABC-type Fe3+-hydroxamate transport system substrate-binding protein